MKNMANALKPACVKALSAMLLTAFLILNFATKSAAQGCPLICKDQITVAVPASGSYELLPAELADASLVQICPAGILQTQAQFGVDWLPSNGNMIFNTSHIGQTYLCRILDQVSGNTCWGNVKVETASPLLDTIHFRLCTEFWKDARPIRGAVLNFQPINPAFPYTPMVINLGSDQSCTDLAIVPNDYLPGTTFSYGASLPDTGHLNGVDIFDLCAINQHILGINVLPSPYAMIAADANKSGSITTFDIIEDKKLIMGIYNELPNNTSWQLLPDYCQFPNPNNPFSPSCQDHINLSELMALDGDTAKVIGLKIGDVNGDARLIGVPDPAPIPQDSIKIILPQGNILTGQILAIPVKMDKAFTYGSLQAIFKFNPTLAQFDSITSGAISFPSNSAYYNTQTGYLRAVIVQNLTIGGLPVPEEDVHFYLHIKALKDAQLEDMLEVITNDPLQKTFGIGVNCEGYYSIESIYSGSVPAYTPELQGVRVQVPSPNPFTEKTALGIELESPETAILELVDLTGRLLFSEQKNLPAGFSQWEIPGAVMAYGSFSIWRLRVGNQAITGKLNRN